MIGLRIAGTAFVLMLFTMFYAYGVDEAAKDKGVQAPRIAWRVAGALLLFGIPGGLIMWIWGI